MAFDREVRSLGGIRGFLDRLRRRQYLGEVAENTKEALEGHIKKIRAEKHVVHISHFNDNVHGIKTGGLEATFEPDADTVKAFNTFDQPGNLERAILGNIGQVVNRYAVIPEPWAVYQTKYPYRELKLVTRNSFAASFDGDTQYINCGVQTSLWSKTINKFTLSFWMRPTAIDDISFRNILSATDGTDTISVFFTPDDTIACDINSASGNANVQINSITELFRAYHVTVTYDKDAGSNQLKLYIDGVLVHQATATFAIAIDAATELHLGRWTPDPIGDFQYAGYLWDFKFWDDTALTSTQVLKNYNNDIDSPIPDYWLPLNDGAGNPIDIIGSEVATLVNGTSYEEGDPRQDFIWIKNAMTFGTVPTILKTGHSLGLNIETVDTLGNTVKRRNQFLTIHHDPHDTFTSFNGIDTFISEADKASLDLTQFSVSVKFRTSGNPLSTGTVQYLVNKGDYLNGGAGQNHNYGLYINNIVGDEDYGKLFGEFQTSASVQHVVGSPGKVTDGKWHTAVLTYDQVTLKLYLDNRLVDSHATTDTPDNATADPLVIGRFSGSSILFYLGDIADVIVWNNDLTEQEVIAHLFGIGQLPQPAAIVYTHWLSNTNLGQRSFDGIDDFIDQADTAALRLTQWTVAARFKTNKDYSAQETAIVTKGGFGSDSAGQNQNYGLSLTTSGNLRGGFEEGTGTDHYATTSGEKYNDGEWHVGLCKYDQVNVSLWVDGHLVATHATAVAPETVNTNPLRIGANPRALDRFFMGTIDFVYVWNNDLTDTEIRNFFNNGVIAQTGAIVFSRVMGELPSTKVNRADFNWLHQNFTESIWFYPTNLTNSSENRILKIHTFDEDNYHSYTIDDADNKILIDFVVNGVSTRFESTIAVTANAWHHLIVTWEFATPTIKARLDDVAMVASVKSGPPDVENWYYPCYGGYPRMDYHEQFMGLIDVHMYYKHDTVLTTGEMTNVYNFNTKFTVNAARSPFVAGAVMATV